MRHLDTIIETEYQLYNIREGYTVCACARVIDIVSIREGYTFQDNLVIVKVTTTTETTKID